MLGSRTKENQPLSSLRLIMKITLISPRIAIQKGDFLGSGVPYWPIELAIFAAFLRNRKDELSVIDLFGSSPTTLTKRKDHYLQGLSIDSFIEEPSFEAVDLFVVYAISYMSHGELLEIVRTIRRAKKDVKVLILENSQAVTAYSLPEVAKDYFKSGANYLLSGEPYWNWEEIMDYIEKPDLYSLPENLLIDEFVNKHQIRRKFNNAPSYPEPAWDLFNLENYWKLPYSHGPKTKRFFPLLTSRGCPNGCDFCVSPVINDRHWRGRSAKEVVNEIVTLRDKFEVRDFQIEDLNPTIDALRWNQICRMLVDLNVKVNLYLVSGTKVETMKLNDIHLYRDAGCRYISISPESGSVNVLKAMGKNFDHSYALDFIKECHRNGIYTQACFLVGHPSESEIDHDKSKDYLDAMVRAGLDEVAVFIVAPLPGSSLCSTERIGLTKTEYLISFSPKGRDNWLVLVRRRKELIRIFFLGKLKKGLGIWFQGARALVGAHRTKMENLPKRMIYVHWLLFKLLIKNTCRG